MPSQEGTSNTRRPFRANSISWFKSRTDALGSGCAADGLATKAGLALGAASRSLSTFVGLRRPRSIFRLVRRRWRRQHPAKRLQLFLIGVHVANRSEEHTSELQ